MMSQYLSSLRARYNKKPPTYSSRGKKNRKEMPALLDLDGNDGDSNLSDSGKVGGSNSRESYDFQDRKREHLEALEKEHICQRCGPNIACKIDKFGKHITLSIPQKSGWAAALV